MYTNDSLSYMHEHQAYTARDKLVKQEPQRRVCYPVSISHWPATNIPEGSVKMAPITGPIGEGCPVCPLRCASGLVPPSAMRGHQMPEFFDGGEGDDVRSARPFLRCVISISHHHLLREVRLEGLIDGNRCDCWIDTHGGHDPARVGSLRPYVMAAH
jgi:hypothetical protein